ncbi:MAG: thiamine pyrophosphate-dependent enzyme [Veillonellales bacterium]
MRKVLYSGNEAIARGAYEAGVRVAVGYPGTPSSEILENIAKLYKEDIYAEWSANEKVAMDVAAGAAYSGVRTIVTTKQVGMNVLSDSLFYLVYTGIEAGVVVVTADDPGMFSSQNEQDNRWYARIGKIPMLEPCDSQESKDMVALGMELSEKFNTPVILRTGMRISHSKSIVNLGEREKNIKSAKEFPRDIKKYNCNCIYSREKRQVIAKRLKDLAQWAETAAINSITWGDRKLGIISSGIVSEYAREVFPNASILKLGMVYPLPEKKIRDFARQVDEVVVIEELDPFLEEQIKAMGISVRGKDIFLAYDELLPSTLREQAVAAKLLPAEELPKQPNFDIGELPSRNAVFCQGCPHRSTFYLLSKLKVPVTGDIGCYNLGCLPPFNAQHTMGSMGASIGQLHGVSAAGGPERAVCTIGDSTFFHAGLPALANMVHNNMRGVIIILDNETTAMTGHQDHPGMDKTLMGKPTAKIDIENLCLAMGVKKVKKVNAFHVKEVEASLKECLAWNDGPAVLIPTGECIFVARNPKQAYAVDANKCIACGNCTKAGCPAIIRIDEINPKTGKRKMGINSVICNGCSVCSQICPTGAIYQTGRKEAAE